MTESLELPAPEAGPANPVGLSLRLQLLADELLTEAASRESLRSTRPLPDPVSGLRQTLIALAGPAVVEASEGRTDGSLHVLRGSARLVAGNACTELQTHDYAPLPLGPHVISADATAVILHSVVVPPGAGSAAMSSDRTGRTR